jgi:tetratricopeptide (TPR) repeat protein
VRAPGAGAGSAVKPDPGTAPIGQPGQGGGNGQPYPGNPCDHGVGCTCFWYPLYGYPFFGGSWYGYGFHYGAWRSIPRDYRQWTVVGPVNQEFQGGPAEPEPWTVYETAVYWMMEGDAEQAVEWYRAHLDENPDDLLAMREYAAAMLEAGRTLDAVAVMAYAYDLAPGLSGRAMDPGLWDGSPLRLRRSVVQAVRAAHAAGTGHAWLLVAVLMQAEGRDAVALRMVDRALEMGLNPAIGERLRRELERR